MRILEKYKKVHAGEDILAEIRLFNLAENGKVPVILRYALKDAQNHTLVEKQKTTSAETKRGTIVELAIPLEAIPGTYQFVVQTQYDGVVKERSEHFEVLEKPTDDVFSTGISSSYFLWGILMVLFLFLLFHFYSMWRARETLEDVQEKIAKHEKRHILEEGRKQRK